MQSHGTCVRIKRDPFTSCTRQCGLTPVIAGTTSSGGRTSTPRRHQVGNLVVAGSVWGLFQSPGRNPGQSFHCKHAESVDAAAIHAEHRRFVTCHTAGYPQRPALMAPVANPPGRPGRLAIGTNHRVCVLGMQWPAYRRGCMLSAVKLSAHISMRAGPKNTGRPVNHARGLPMLERPTNRAAAPKRGRVAG